VVCLAASAW